MGGTLLGGEGEEICRRTPRDFISSSQFQRKWKSLVFFQSINFLCLTPYLTYAWGALRETREGWSLLTVKTEANALQRKSHLCIPFLGIARPSVPMSTFMCLWAIYIFQNRSSYFLQQNRQIDCGNNNIQIAHRLQLHLKNFWLLGNFELESVCARTKTKSAQKILYYAPISPRS